MLSPVAEVAGAASAADAPRLTEHDRPPSCPTPADPAEAAAAAVAADGGDDLVDRDSPGQDDDMSVDSAVLDDETTITTAATHGANGAPGTDQVLDSLANLSIYTRTAAKPGEDAFEALPDELVCAIFHSLPKMYRFRCLFLNRRLSRLAATCLWRSVGCWIPSFPETRLTKILNVLDGGQCADPETDPFAPPATIASALAQDPRPSRHAAASAAATTPPPLDPILAKRPLLDAPRAARPTTQLMYPYLTYVRKIVIMIYNVTDPHDLYVLVTRIRRVLLEKCSTARRLTLAYRGPAHWALDPRAGDAGGILRHMHALDQLGLYWVTHLTENHLHAIADNCHRLRLLHLQPDRSVRSVGLRPHPAEAVAADEDDDDDAVMDDADDDDDAEDDDDEMDADVNAEDPARTGTWTPPHASPHGGPIDPPPDPVPPLGNKDGDLPLTGPDAAMARILHRNGHGRLHELNLWHLPLTGAYFRALHLPAMKLLTIGNMALPERALLALTATLPNLSSLTVDHPRDRPRRAPHGVAHLVSLAPNLKALYLKHIVLESTLARAIASRAHLATLVLAPYDYRAPAHEVAVDDLVVMSEYAYPAEAAARLLSDERTDHDRVMAMLARGCAKLASLELWGTISGTTLALVAELPELRELKIKNAMDLRVSDIRQFVTRMAGARSAAGARANADPGSSTTNAAAPPLRALHLHAAHHMQDMAVMQLLTFVPTLRYLTISESRITAELLWFLAMTNNHALRRLTVSGPHVRRRDVHRIVDEFPDFARRFDVEDAARPQVVVVAAAQLVQQQMAAQMAAAAHANGGVANVPHVPVPGQAAVVQQVVAHGQAQVAEDDTLSLDDDDEEDADVDAGEDLALDIVFEAAATAAAAAAAAHGGGAQGGGGNNFL
ncbi:hypothetical protein GGF32_009810 [Allomyces javanicus]|nr:hypothetical protein GGF32_009810 [Allomyces javanicus]